MNWIILFWFTCLIHLKRCSTEQVYTDEKLNNAMGFYYENIGNLHLYNDEWKMIIYLDFEDVREQYKRIESLHTQFTSLCNTFIKRELIVSLCEMINPQLDQTLNILHAQNKLISNILGSRTDLISKRGLVNAVGSLAKQLFGTLDENDAVYYDEQIKILHENEKHLQSLLNQQTSVKESVVGHINKTIGFINELNTKISKIAFRMSKLENSTIINESTTHNAAAINEVFAIFTSVSDRFQIVQTHIVDILTSASRGILHPYVINAEELLKELVKIQNILPKSISLPIKLDMDEMDILYKIVKTHVFYKNKNLCFVLEIPLIRNIEFQIFKITSVPVRIDEKAFTIVIPEKELLIIDAVKQHYLLYDVQELQGCLETRKTKFICEQKSPVHISHTNNNCVRSLFDPVNSIPKSCSSRVMVLHLPIFLQLAQSNAWIYVTPNPERLFLTCKAENHQATLNGTGILTIKPGCEARSENSILNSKTIFNSKVNLKQFNEIPELPKIKLNTNAFQTLKNTVNNVSTGNTFSIENQIKSLEKISVDVNELNKQTVSIKDIEKHDNHLSFLTIVTIFIIIVICIVLLYKLYKICRLRKQLEMNVSLKESFQRISSKNKKHVKNQGNQDVELEIINEEPKVPKHRSKNENHTNPRYNFRL